MRDRRISQVAKVSLAGWPYLLLLASGFVLLASLEGRGTELEEVHGSETTCLRPGRERPSLVIAAARDPLNRAVLFGPYDNGRKKILGDLLSGATDPSSRVPCG